MNIFVLCPLIILLIYILYVERGFQVSSNPYINNNGYLKNSTVLSNGYGYMQFYLHLNVTVRTPRQISPYRLITIFAKDGDIFCRGSVGALAWFQLKFEQ